MPDPHDDGGPAFPQAGLATINGSVADFRSLSPGLSLWDYMAGQALAGAIAAHEDTGCSSNDPEVVKRERAEHRRVMVEYAYDLADAMIAEKRRREGGGA